MYMFGLLATLPNPHIEQLNKVCIRNSYIPGTRIRIINQHMSVIFQPALDSHNIELASLSKASWPRRGWMWGTCIDMDGYCGILLVVGCSRIWIGYDGVWRDMEGCGWINRQPVCKLRGARARGTESATSNAYRHLLRCFAGIFS